MKPLVVIPIRQTKRYSQTNNDLPLLVIVFLIVELQPHFYHALPKAHFNSSAIIRLLQKGSRMKNEQCTTFIHADDFGITPVQAKEILSLSSSCNGIGALNSVSIFANSPAFDEAVSLAQPCANRGVLRVCLHLNLVEGPSLSNPERIPLLVNENGMFKNNFVGLLKLGIVNKHDVFDQLVIECRSQIQRYLSAFPNQQLSFQLDSHQHVHAIPVVYKALAQALIEENCQVMRLREPIDPLSVYRSSIGNSSKESDNTPMAQTHKASIRIPMVNRAKIFLISALWRKCPVNDIPWSPNRPSSAPLFSGVALSGHMDEFNKPLLVSFQYEAARQGRDAEILFHPISVPIKECLDPLNVPFAEACASESRNREAALIRKL